MDIFLKIALICTVVVAVWIIFIRLYLAGKPFNITQQGAGFVTKTPNTLSDVHFMWLGFAVMLTLFAWALAVIKLIWHL